MNDRFHALNEYVERGQAALRAAGCPGAAALWFTLWKHEDRRTGLARVGAAKLATQYGTDRRNVQRMLGELERHGYLSVVEPGKPGRGSCAVYRLHSVPVKRGHSDAISDTGEGASGAREKASPAPGKGVTVTQVQSTSTKYSSAMDGNGFPRPLRLTLRGRGNPFRPSG